MSKAWGRSGVPRLAQLAHVVDWAPTILALAGSSAGAAMDGVGTATHTSTQVSLWPAHSI